MGCSQKGGYYIGQAVLLTRVLVAVTASQSFPMVVVMLELFFARCFARQHAEAVACGLALMVSLPFRWGGQTRAHVIVWIGCPALAPFSNATYLPNNL